MRHKQLPLVIACDMLTYSNFKTKKMYSRYRNGNSSNIMGNTPPTLHKGVRWFVDFIAWDPVRNAMRRKRCYIKDSLSVSVKKRSASVIIAVLIKQFSQDWNPWVTNDESRSFVLFENFLEHYAEYVERMDWKKARQDYSSRICVLREFIAQQTNPIKYAYQFDITFCTDFIDWIYLDSESSARTRILCTAYQRFWNIFRQYGAMGNV